MSYLVLARKWRPQRFAEVVGQRHVSQTLTNALQSDRLSHAYLFAGPRGVGKTSMARILAKALNCEQQPATEPCNTCAACKAITDSHCLDVLEIDGASNRGIDDVRQLREGVKYAPSSVRTKVYIIDEVHMLTTDAFNALLKTLEEPPRHVYFVLATTEPLKVPPTILSRCQRHDFGRLTVGELAENLRRIVTAEEIAIDEEALRLLARKADGSVRDSLTLLDQVAATGSGPFDAARVQELLGLTGSGLLFALSAAVTAGDGAGALGALQRAYREGVNLQELADELVGHFRQLLLLAFDHDLDELLETTPEERAQLAAQAKGVRAADALRWLRILLDVASTMRRSAHGRVHLEVALVEMAALPRAADLATVLDHLRRTGTTAAGVATAGAESGATGVVDRERPAGSAAGAPPAVAVRAPAPDGVREAATGATPPRAVALGTDEADRLLRGWGLVLERVRKERAFLGSCLHASQPLGIEAGRLLVELDDANGFKREQVEKPANRRFLLQMMAEAYEQQIGLRLVEPTAVAANEMSPAPSAPPSASSSPAPSAPPSASSSPAPSAPPSTTTSPAPAAASASPPGAATTPPEARTPGSEQSPEPPAGRDRVREIADLVDGDIVGPAY